MSDVYINRVYFPPWGSTEGGDEIANYVILQANASLLIGTMYAVDTTVARTLTLPPLAFQIPGSWILIQDLTGLALTNPITINPYGSDEINGVVSNSILFERTSGSGRFIVGPGSLSWYLAT
jgi:hypothetical protein